MEPIGSFTQTKSCGAYHNQLAEEGSRMNSSNAAQPSPDEIIAMLPMIAQATEEAARRSGIAPTEMQSSFWVQAVHNR